MQHVGPLVQWIINFQDYSQVSELTLAYFVNIMESQPNRGSRMYTIWVKATTTDIMLTNQESSAIRSHNHMILSRFVL